MYRCSWIVDHDISLLLTILDIALLFEQIVGKHNAPVHFHLDPSRMSTTAGPDPDDWRRNPVIRIAVPIGIIAFTLLVIIACFVGMRRYLRSRRKYEYETEMSMVSRRSRKSYTQHENIVLWSTITRLMNWPWYDLDHVVLWYPKNNYWSPRLL